MFLNQTFVSVVFQSSRRSLIIAGNRSNQILLYIATGIIASVPLVLQIESLQTELPRCQRRRILFALLG